MTHNPFTELAPPKPRSMRIIGWFGVYAVVVLTLLAWWLIRAL
jgi:hypothetical protein